MSLLSSLAYLKDLEAESIYILREAAADFARPAVLYSIGKDSSVLLRLALKAFYPGCIPFTFLRRVEERRGCGSCGSSPVSVPRSSNRTCGFPASGFPTDFVTCTRRGPQ